MATILLSACARSKVRNHIVAVTNRAILLAAVSLLAELPLDLAARLPRQTPLGPFEGRGWITVNGIRLCTWIAGRDRTI